METRLKRSLKSCGICLENIEFLGQLNCCSHHFCFSCIKNWAKVTNFITEIENSCPVCKKRFSKILQKPNRKLYVNNPKQK